MEFQPYVIYGFFRFRWHRCFFSRLRFLGFTIVGGFRFLFGFISGMGSSSSSESIEFKVSPSRTSRTRTLSSPRVFVWALTSMCFVPTRERSRSNVASLPEIVMCSCETHSVCSVSVFTGIVYRYAGRVRFWMFFTFFAFCRFWHEIDSFYTIKYCFLSPPQAIFLRSQPCADQNFTLLWGWEGGVPLTLTKGTLSQVS